MATVGTLTIGVMASLLLAASGTFYYYVIHLPAREARLDAQRHVAELANQQERCAKQAADAWKQGGIREITDTKDGHNMNSYQNHYDPDSGKCFLLSMTEGVHARAVPQYIDYFLTLTDLTENKGYGDFYMRNDSAKPVICNVRNKPCASREEWKALAKPFIGDIE